MAVEITNKCDRCGRSESLHVSHDDLMLRLEDHKATDATIAQITQTVREIWEKDSTHFPGVITIVVKDGELVIQDKVSLCGPDKSRSRGGHGCAARVSQLVDEIHLDKKKE